MINQDMKDMSVMAVNIKSHINHTVENYEPDHCLAWTKALREIMEIQLLLVQIKRTTLVTHSGKLPDVE